MKEKGIVTESLPDLRYRIQLESGRDLIAYTSGKMKLHRIRMVVGDKVEVELDEYGGKATNRITRRL